ncbi:MAG: hypothetical protein WAT79_07980 [Saprospiraceae bacterium]
MAFKHVDFIEKKYPDLLVAEGEILYENKAIVDYKTPEKLLHSLVVHDQKDWDIELFKPFTKIQKTTCSCKDHAQNGACKHVIAGLFYLQKLRDKPKKVVKENQTPKIKTLSVQNILPFIEKEELAQFIKQYAKSDARFSLQFKVHFARKIDLPDNKEKYKMLLDTIIRPYTGKSKPGFNELRAFLNVTEGLLGQIEDCLALQQYNEAFHIIEAAFLKFEYVRHYYGMNNPFFSTQSKKWHNVLISFYKEKIPYVLRKNLTEFLLELSNASYYRYSDLTSNILYVFGKVLSDSERKKIGTIILTYEPTIDNDEKLKIIALVVSLIGELPLKLEKRVFSPGFAFSTFIQHIFTLGLFDKAKEMIERKLKHTGFDRELYIILLDIYLEGLDWKNAFDKAFLLFIRTADIYYLTKFKNAIGQEKWQKTYSKEAEKQLLALRNKKPDLLYSFYQEEQQWDALIQELFLQEDIKVVHKYAADLFFHCKNDLEILYSKKIFFYLESHMGESSYEYIDNLFRTLDKHRLAPFKLELKKRILEYFGQRQGLVQYLRKY